MNESDWKSYIANLKKTKYTSNKTKLKDTLITAIKSQLPKKHFGIFFSGGIDSSLLALICKQLNADFTCYTVGLENADDLKYAGLVAKSLNVPLKTKVLMLQDAEKIIGEVIKILPIKDVVNVGVASVVYAAAKLAKKDNVSTFFSGLGSEEIFAGYQRHAEAEDKHEECWNGLKNMYQRDVVRDTALAKSLKITVLNPFLEKDVILNAMAISIKRKINKKQKKIILREIAQELGLKEEFAQRPKKAAQYGSKFDKAIEKLAKISGYRFKKDYLDSLC